MAWLLSDSILHWRMQGRHPLLSQLSPDRRQIQPDVEAPPESFPGGSTYAELLFNTTYLACFIVNTYKGWGKTQNKIWMRLLILQADFCSTFYIRWKGGGAVLECDVIYANWDIKITNDDTLNVISIYASEDMNNEKIYEHCDINIQLLYANNQWFSFVVY